VKSTNVVLTILIVLLTLTLTINAQQNTNNENRTRVTPNVDYSGFMQDKKFPVAVRTNLYCAGFIQVADVDKTLEVVGGEDEQEQRTYSQFDYIYISAGANRGVKVGDEFTVVRPRGSVRSEWTSKGNLGNYVQEVGLVKVVDVKDQVSVGQIVNSCEAVLLGDLLERNNLRVSPLRREEPTFDRFRDPNGKTQGNIVLAKNGHELVSRDQVVYIDLGVEDNVKVGDYFTIYRPLGKGNVTNFKDGEIVRSKDYGFESLRYRGGKFSNQSPRRKNADAEGITIVTTPNAKSRRPDGLRKVVGELVIVNVKERTATAVITRTAQEIIVGDRVELQ
jgi:hypothetical protein